MQQTRLRHPVFARAYAWASLRMERELADRRRSMLRALTGRVIEVGAGNGLNFAHYPQEVDQVLAVEPEPYLRALAVRAARRAPVPVEVVDGTADRLPARDGSFDAAVASLILCSVPEQPAALAEILRVLRPGGELRFLEHVRADSVRLSGVQRLLDATIWPTLGGGCHAGRDTAAAIGSAGFTVQWLDRFRFPDVRIPLPTSPHILGSACRPA